MGTREEGEDATVFKKEAGRSLGDWTGTAPGVAGMSVEDGKFRPGMLNQVPISQDLVNEEDELTLYFSSLCDS